MLDQQSDVHNVIVTPFMLLRVTEEWHCSIENLTTRNTLRRATNMIINMYLSMPSLQRVYNIGIPLEIVVDKSSTPANYLDITKQ